MDGEVEENGQEWNEKKLDDEEVYNHEEVI